MNTLLYYFFYTLCYLLSLLPFWLLYLLSDLFYLLVYYCVRYRRRVVRANLTGSFPEKSLQEIVKIEKQYYAFFCDYVFETFKLISISKKEMRKRMKFEGLEEINATFAEGKNIAAYLGHYCNWEWISSLQLSMPEGVISGQIYHKLRNEVSDQIFLKLRSRMGAVSIPMKETGRKLVMMRREKKPFIIGFIADQSPKWANIHHWIPFMHRETAVFTGTERLAKQMNMAVYYIHVSRPRRGYYVATFEKMMDNPKEYPDYAITDEYMRRLEKSIRCEPQYWLWSHKRWKRTREEFERLFETTPDGRVKRRNNTN